MPKRKSMAITTVLAILIGGVGHIYVGKTKRGIVILIIDLVSGALFSIVPHFFIPEGEVNPLETNMYHLALFVSATIGLVIFFIWQIIDARKECRKYNSTII